MNSSQSLQYGRTEDSLFRCHSGMKAKNCRSQPVSFKGSLNKSSPAGSSDRRPILGAIFWASCPYNIRILPLTGAWDPLKNKTFNHFTVLSLYLRKQSRNWTRNVHLKDTLIWLWNSCLTVHHESSCPRKVYARHRKPPHGPFHLSLKPTTQVTQSTQSQWRELICRKHFELWVKISYYINRNTSFHLLNTYYIPGNRSKAWAL